VASWRSRLGQIENLAPVEAVIASSAIFVVAYVYARANPVVFSADEYLPIHTLLEMVTISISASIFFVRWFPRRFTHNPQSLVVGVLFFSLAAFHTVHALTYSGMPDFLGPTSTALPTYYWILARFTFAFFLVAATFIPREGTPKLAKPSVVFSLFAVYTIASIAIVAAYINDLPRLVIPGQGVTDLKIDLEYFIIALLAIASFRFWQWARRTKRMSYVYLTVGLIIAVFEELAFTLYSSVYDSFNLLGHLFGVASFLFVFLALFRTSIIAPYESLERTTAELRKSRDELELRVQERTTELSKSNTELEHFAYVASHDLRAPMTTISGYLQLLKEKSDMGRDADATTFITTALNNLRRMQEMIDSLLTRSKMNKEDRPLAPVDMNSVVYQARANLEAAIVETGAALTIGQLPELPADEPQMIQLFQNLIDNAIKFRAKAKPRIEINAHKENSEWIFSVRDNGIGFDMKDTNRLFKTYEQLDTSNERPGTGIGLSTCKRIVEYHKGRIWAESAPDKGSTFYFSIPASERNESAGSDRI
jgi:signal transduction histidine kinase